MKLSVNIIELDNEYIANCPELDINCYGVDKSEAVRRIVNVLQFYIDSAKELGIDVESIDDIKIDGLPENLLFPIESPQQQKSHLIN